MQVCKLKVLNVLYCSFSSPYLDPLQFACHNNRSTQDAVLVVHDNLHIHLERVKFGISAPYFFPSAFNTFQHHVLVQKVLRLKNIPHFFIYWLLNHLTNRTQLFQPYQDTNSDVLVSKQEPHKARFQQQAQATKASVTKTRYPLSFLPQVI